MPLLDKMSCIRPKKQIRNEFTITYYWKKESPSRLMKHTRILLYHGKTFSLDEATNLMKTTLSAKKTSRDNKRDNQNMKSTKESHKSI